MNRRVNRRVKTDVARRNDVLKSRKLKMKMIAWLEKNPPEAESDTQNGVFLQRR